MQLEANIEAMEIQMADLKRTVVVRDADVKTLKQELETSQVGGRLSNP